MKTRTSAVAAVLAALLAVPALAQVQINLPLPTIRFDVPPPLVVVTPGVQVVPDYDDEVFFSDGWYWVNRQDRWYRTRDHRGGWVVVERQYVPQTIVVLPRGKYKRWKADKAERREQEKGDRGKHKGHGKH